MSLLHTSFLSAAAILSLGLFACVTSNSNSNAPEATTPENELELADPNPHVSDSHAPEATTPENELESVGQNPRVSECGGFNAKTRDDDSYCDAEFLRWSYNESSQTLSLLNQRVLLNCCGEHKFTVTHDRTRDVYVVDELDQPKNGSRCRCMCTYDWSTDVSVAPGTINLELARHVSDGDGRQVIWSGKIDVTETQGEVVISDRPLKVFCH